MRGIFILIALFCIPPVLSFRAMLRRLRHSRERGRPTGLFLAGAVFSAITLAFDLAVIGTDLLHSGISSTELGAKHAAALGLSWLCLWVWIIALIVYRRGRIRPY